LQIDIEQQT